MTDQSGATNTFQYALYGELVNRGEEGMMTDENGLYCMGARYYLFIAVRTLWKKDRLNFRRMQVSSELSLNGKLFVEFVALIYLSYVKK